MPKIAPYIAAGLMFAAGSALARSDNSGQIPDTLAAPAAQPLTICLASAPYGLDPARRPAGSASELISRAVFDTLVVNGDDGQAPRPRLALWWEMSPDGLTYTFRLRQGVAFHQTSIFEPTRTFGADDVVFTFERLISSAHPLAPAGTGGDLVASIERVENVGNDEVRFTLKAPNSGFLMMLARDFAAIQSAEYGEKIIAAGQPWMLDTNPVGTGPFSIQVNAGGSGAATAQGPQRKPRFEVITTSAGPVIRTFASIPVLSEQNSRKPLKSIKLSANTSYWDGAPSSESLVFDVETDVAERYGRLIRGACQIMPDPAEADMDALAANPDVGVIETIGTDTVYLAFNTQEKPLDNSWVRLALSEAVDLDALGRLKGVNGTAAGALVQSANDRFPVERRIFSTNFAEAHLAGADVTAPVLRLLVPVAAVSDTTPVADRLAKAWENVGAKVTIEKTLWADVLPALSGGDYDIALLVWRADSADLLQNYRMILSCDTIGKTNASRWCDTSFMADLQSATNATNPAEHMTATKKAVQRVASELPILPLLYLKRRWAVRTEIAGLDPAALANANLTGAMIKAAQPLSEVMDEPDIDPESGENVAEGGG